MADVAASIAPGFRDPSSASAVCFRAVLEAMSRPGRIVGLRGLAEAPLPLAPVAAAVALTLFDNDTPVWLSGSLATPAVTDYLRFHTGCPITADPGHTAFALAGACDEVPDLPVFGAGTDLYPDRSATVIVQVERLKAETGVTLRGPGIEEQHLLAVAPSVEAFWRQLAANSDRFPLGIDVVFCAPAAVAAVPRSTRISMEG